MRLKPRARRRVRVAPRLQRISNESMKKTEGGLLAEKGSKDPKKKAKGRSSTTMGLKEAQTISQLARACPHDVDGSEEPTSKKAKITVEPSSYFFFAIIQQSRCIIAKALPHINQHSARASRPLHYDQFELSWHTT